MKTTEDRAMITEATDTPEAFEYRLTHGIIEARAVAPGPDDCGDWDWCRQAAFQASRERVIAWGALYGLVLVDATSERSESRA